MGYFRGTNAMKLYRSNCSEEARCGNGWCKDEAVKCNGSNPCGTISECNTISVTVEQFLLIFLAFLVVFLVLLALIEHLWRRGVVGCKAFKKRMKRCYELKRLNYTIFGNSIERTDDGNVTTICEECEKPAVAKSPPPSRENHVMGNVFATRKNDTQFNPICNTEIISEGSDSARD